MRRAALTRGKGMKTDTPKTRDALAHDVRRSAILLTILVTAGCAGRAGLDPAAGVPEPPAPSMPAFGPGVVAADECAFLVFASCYEPSVAAPAPDRLVVTNGIAGAGRRSTDGGATFEPWAEPPLPLGAPPGSLQADVLVQARDGRLYWSALVVQFAGLVLVLQGVQVAVSLDDGDSWSVNRLLSVPASTSSSLGADRQWLALGPNGTVYATYHQTPPVIVGVGPAGGALFEAYPNNRLMVARSDDGGETWTDWAPVNAPGGYIGGPPVVDAAGRLLVPFIDYAEPPHVGLAVSEDGGVTFEERTVFAADAPGDFFPAVLPVEGALVAAWRGPEKTVLVAATRDDGATWSAPVAWSAPGETTPSSPWILAGPRGIDVAYYAIRHGEDASLVMARGALAAAETGEAVERADVTGPIDGATMGRRAFTDFAHVVASGDGLVATWVRAGTEVLVATAARAG